MIHSFIQKVFTKRYHASGFPSGVVVKNLPVNIGDARDAGSIPGLRSFPGIGNGSLLQYSCLENSMDRGAWRATVHEVAKRQTRQVCLHHVPGTILNSGDRSGNKIGKNPHPVDLTPGAIDMKCEVLVVQSCPTLCDPMDCKLPGSSVHGILQARKLEWVAIPFSK